jgi:hypothetical protein
MVWFLCNDPAHLYENFLSGNSFAASREAARDSFDVVVELIKKQSGADVPQRQVEGLTVRAARDFDAFYRDQLCPPEETDHLLVLSFDAKGVATCIAIYARQRTETRTRSVCCDIHLIGVRFEPDMSLLRTMHSCYKLGN